MSASLCICSDFECTSKGEHATHFGHALKGSILSYQVSDYEKPSAVEPEPRVCQDLPPLPITAISTMLSIPSDISNEQQAILDQLKVTLEEAHQLEHSKQQQSVKWQTSTIGRVTASRFGVVLIWQSPPSAAFVKSYLERKEYSSLPVQLKHGQENEVKARNVYISSTGLMVHLCGLVVNPTFPWLGASLDGLVLDSLEISFSILKIKCPYTYRLSTVE